MQSGYRPGDSTVNQILYLTHKIYEAFEQGKEVRVVFLDISKAFDRVWHNGLLYKLKSIGVRDPNLVSWFESYLLDRKRVGRILMPEYPRGLCSVHYYFQFTLTI